MMQKRPLFRQASLDSISAPEQLNDYIRVVNPSMWLLLAAVVLLLLGVLTWSILGTVTTRVTAVAEAVNGEAVCYVDPANAKRLKAGMKAQLGENEGTVVSVSDAPIRVGDDENPIQTGNGFKAGDICYAVTLAADNLDDGVYAVDMIVEQIAPIKFVIGH